MRLSRTSTLTALLAVTVTAASTGTAQAVDPNTQAEAIADQISHGWGINFHFNRTETKLYASYAVEGMAGGTAACAVAGGALGTVVTPVVGSAVGAAIGGAGQW